jgi:hypothetical protein
MTSDHKPLLGRLANRWFNEVIATDALRLLLDDPVTRSAFLALVSQAAAVDLSEIRAFERERTTVDGRIDLQGVDVQGRPRLVIEAKFGHTMSPEQMAKYLSHQDNELAGAAPGVLLLLVPAGRIGLAREVMAFVRSTTAGQVRDAPSIEPIALSWEDCLSALEAAVGERSANPASPAADIAQLRAVCETLGGWSAPLMELPDAEHAQYLRVVLEQLKDRVRARNFGPLQGRDPDYTEFRYFGVPQARSSYSVGLTHRFDAERLPRCGCDSTRQRRTSRRSRRSSGALSTPSRSGRAGDTFGCRCRYRKIWGTPRVPVGLEGPVCGRFVFRGWRTSFQRG